MSKTNKNFFGYDFYCCLIIALASLGLAQLISWISEKTNCYFMSGGSELTLWYVLALFASLFFYLLARFCYWLIDCQLHHSFFTDFYLHDKKVYWLNSLVYLGSVFWIILLFANRTTLIAGILLLTTNYYWEKDSDKELTAGYFFSWHNHYLYKPFFFLLVSRTFFLLSGWKLFNSLKTQIGKEVLDEINGLLKKIPLIDLLFDFCEKNLSANSISLIFLLLAFFAPSIVNQRQTSFNSFWQRVDGITERKNNFLNFYYYQKELAFQQPFFVVDYNYFLDCPNFVRNGLTLNKAKSLVQTTHFLSACEEVVDYINLCEKNIEKKSLLNYLYESLFFRFQNWDDFNHFKKLLTNNSWQ